MKVFFESHGRLLLIKLHLNNISFKTVYQADDDVSYQLQKLPTGKK